IELYWERDEQAIAESEKKYGAYCRAVAHNILSDAEDEEECVNDTWLRAWNVIPPERPRMFSVFLGKITRNLAIDLYRRKTREKRGGGETALVLDELSECVSGNDDPVDKVMEHDLREQISNFLRSLPPEKRSVFVLRYWYAESVSNIAKRFGMTTTNVSVTLSRLRAGLKKHLTERGWNL
ncbi:MAG: sigma-70 family RNA polymerase sigma factor, partial [Lachnospiraceae bacterium]|nr:sigma-70 family RNA polymerase sigma factor [Lachnospiraceae bacterium]